MQILFTLREVKFYFSVHNRHRRFDPKKVSHTVSIQHDWLFFCLMPCSKSNEFFLSGYTAIVCLYGTTRDRFKFCHRNWNSQRYRSTFANLLTIIYTLYLLFPRKLCQTAHTHTCTPWCAHRAEWKMVSPHSIHFPFLRYSPDNVCAVFGEICCATSQRYSTHRVTCRISMLRGDCADWKMRLDQFSEQENRKHAPYTLRYTNEYRWKLVQVAPKTGMFRVCFGWCVSYFRQFSSAFFIPWCTLSNCIAMHTNTLKRARFKRCRSHRLPLATVRTSLSYFAILVVGSLCAEYLWILFNVFNIPLWPSVDRTRAHEADTNCRYSFLRQ